MVSEKIIDNPVLYPLPSPDNGEDPEAIAIQFGFF